MSGLDIQLEQSDNNNPACKKIVSRLRYSTSHIKLDQHKPMAHWLKWVAVSRATWLLLPAALQPFCVVLSQSVHWHECLCVAQLSMIFFFRFRPISGHDYSWCIALSKSNRKAWPWFSLESLNSWKTRAHTEGFSTLIPQTGASCKNMWHKSHTAASSGHCLLPTALFSHCPFPVLALQDLDLAVLLSSLL